MQKYKFVVVGGGPAGLAVLESLHSQGETSVLLLEARNQLAYSLTWMQTVPFQGTGAELRQTGTEFRQSLVRRLQNSNSIKLNARVFSVDTEQRIAQVILDGTHHEHIQFRHLFCAPGAVQILYGRHLLPGQRTHRLFTTYQAGEMLAHYPYLPGRRVLFYGSSAYTVEVVNQAYQRGIAAVVVNPTSFDPQMSALLPEIPVHTNSPLQAVTGKAVFEGIEVAVGNGSRELIPGDALVVDGDFVLEHLWRDMLGVKWDLHAWRAVAPEDAPVTLLGDAQSPSPDFAAQYQAAQLAVEQTTAYVNVHS